MRKLVATVGALASSSVNAIVVSASGTAGTAMTLTATPVILDKPRRVLVTFAGNETGHNFTLAGTNWAGFPVSETIAGTNGTTAQSLYDYATVTSFTPVSNTTSTVQVGTNGVASTIPLRLDEWSFAPTAIQVDVTGTVNVTVQQTLNDCDNASDFTVANWINHPDTNLVGATGVAQGSYGIDKSSPLPAWARLLLNSGTGSAKITLLQAGPTGH